MWVAQPKGRRHCFDYIEWQTIWRWCSAIENCHYWSSFWNIAEEHDWYYAAELRSWVALEKKGEY